MIQAILFDLDGLMVDSEPHSRASWQAVMARRGVTLEPSVLDGILGQRLIETARLFARGTRTRLRRSPASGCVL